VVKPANFGATFDVNEFVLLVVNIIENDCRAAQFVANSG
jgi:hypothetical protein